MATKLLTVKEAFDAMNAIGVEQQDIVEQSVKTANQQGLKLAADPELRKVKQFGIGVVKDVGLDYVKSKGGFYQYAAWSVQGFEAAKDVIIIAEAKQAGKVLGKSIFKLGAAASVVGLISFFLDVAEFAISTNIKNKTKKAKQQYDDSVDKIFLAYGQTRDAIASATPALLDRAHNTILQVVNNYSGGAANSLLLGAMDKKQNSTGRKAARAIVSTMLLADLRAIHQLENEHFEYRRIASAFVAQARIASSSKANTDYGFPNYNGHYVVGRLAMYKTCISEIQPLVEKLVEMQNRLNKTAGYLWTMLRMANGIQI